MKVLEQATGCSKSFLSGGKREFSFPLKVLTAKMDYYTFVLQAVSHQEAHWDLKTPVNDSDYSDQWPFMASSNFCRF